MSENHLGMVASPEIETIHEEPNGRGRVAIVHKQDSEEGQPGAIQHVDKDAVPFAAMTQSSHGHTSHINILDLSLDILRLIFDEFHDFKGTSRGGTNWGWDNYSEDNNGHRLAIQNSRLVCRLFCEVTSSLLFPILRVRLNQSSLDVVKGVANNPLLAAGVRGIEVLLDYSSEVLAADLVQFKNQRVKELREFGNACGYCAETWELGGYDEDDESVCSLPYRVYSDAQSEQQAIVSAWNEYLYPTEEETEAAKDLEYQQLLLQSFKTYQQNNEEQLQLITDGSFVNTLASAMSQIAHSGSLHFINETDSRSGGWKPTVVLLDKVELAKFMVSPHDWAVIEELGGKLPPAKILTELPIAMYNAGVSLRELHLSCFTVKESYFPTLWPDRGRRLDPEDFQAACQNLETFEIGDGSMNCHRLRYDYMSQDDQIAFNMYLGAALSSQYLEDVCLCLSAFGINNGTGPGRAKKGFHGVDSILGPVKWLRAKHITIMYLEIHQDELERFCKGLGYGLERIYFCGVHLLDGTWENVLDILREKVGSRHLNGKCGVNFRSLTGGEFGNLNEDEQPNAVNDLVNWESYYTTTIKEDQLIIVKSQNYVAGIDGVQNPLKKSLTS